MLAPRENLNLLGHQEAQETFLKAFHSERFSHAWIVTGLFGIGKATFAFHMARYILSGRTDGNTEFTGLEPFHRRMVAQSHGDLRVLGEEESREIGVESIRELNGFLNQTSAEGGWRVIIIDGADSLNRNAANALLKRLEEPPPKTVFFLTASLPGCLLPTIRSRCQFISLLPLEEEHIKEVLRSQHFEIPDFLSISQGSPGRLMRLMEGKGTEIYETLQRIFRGEPALSFIQTYGGEEISYALIEDLLRNFLYNHLLAKAKGQPSYFEKVSLDQALLVYERIEELLDQCRFAQLDRKATLSCVFAKLQNRNPE